MENFDTKHELRKTPDSLTFDATADDNSSAGAARALDVSEAEQGELMRAMIGLGLDPSTAPSLSDLRAPRVEIEPAPRQSKAELAFQPLDAGEWKLFRSAIENTLGRSVVDWKRKRQHWDCWLFKHAVGVNWTRLPSRVGGGGDGPRKAFEAAALTGVLASACETLLDHPAISKERRVQLQKVRDKANATRERVTDFRATGVRTAIRHKPISPT